MFGTGAKDALTHVTPRRNLKTGQLVCKWIRQPSASFFFFFPVNCILTHHVWLGGSQCRFIPFRADNIHFTTDRIYPSCRSNHIERQPLGEATTLFGITLAPDTLPSLQYVLE